jgi:hypothetical protein
MTGTTDSYQNLRDFSNRHARFKMMAVLAAVWPHLVIFCTRGRIMLRPRPLSRSTVESLEARICPAVTIQAGVNLDNDGAADDLKIVGGSENTIVYLQDDGFGSAVLLVSVDINGDGDFLDVGELKDFAIAIADDDCVIDIQLGGGNDKVLYGLSDDLVNSVRHISIDLGSGNDEFEFAPDQFEAKTGSLILLDLLGGTGNDKVRVPALTVLNSEVVVNAILGAGNDQFLAGANYSTADVIDQGGRLNYIIDLGPGTNLVLTNFHANVGLTASGQFGFSAVGGSGFDEVNVYSSISLGNGTSASSASFAAELGSGNDKFSFNAQTLAVETNSSMNVWASGGSGNDQLLADYTETVATTLKGSVGIDLLGGIGADKLISNFVGSSSNQINLIGQLRINLQGQEGADIFEAYAAVTAASTGNYSLIAMGSNGNDKAYASLVKNGSAITLGKTGKLIIDGGLGTDTLGATGVPLANLDFRFFEVFV